MNSLLIGECKTCKNMFVMIETREALVSYKVITFCFFVSLFVYFHYCIKKVQKINGEINRFEGTNYFKKAQTRERVQMS